MNIFWLSTDLDECAAYACDQHIVKMITEHTQMLCTALYLHGLDDLPMRPSHAKHPCVLWTAKRFANFYCLARLNHAYYAEYRRRFNSSSHGGFSKMELLLDRYGPDDVLTAYADRHETKLNILRACPTSFISLPPQTMPDPYKVRGASLDVVVQAYRNFYTGSKKEFARYAHSQPPSFML